MSFDEHERRRYMLDYLVDVEKVWEPTEPWVLKDVDIYKQLMEFRWVSIEKAKSSQTVREVRVLSLSNVFVVGLDVAGSALDRAPAEYYKTVTKIFKAKDGWDALLGWCANGPNEWSSMYVKGARVD